MDRPRINLLRIEEELSEVHLRLARIQIENLPWQDFIKRSFTLIRRITKHRSTTTI